MSREHLAAPNHRQRSEWLQEAATDAQGVVMGGSYLFAFVLFILLALGFLLLILVDMLQR